MMMQISPVHQVLGISNKTNKVRHLSREELINKMENEQDAIVNKLLREIDQLKRENRYLRSTINNFNKRRNSNKNLTNNNIDNRLHIFESDNENCTILDNASLNLYTPSHSRRSSMNKISTTSNIEGHDHLYLSSNIPCDYIFTTTTTTINHIHDDFMNNRRRNTSSSIYHITH